MHTHNSKSPVHKECHVFYYPSSCVVHPTQQQCLHDPVAVPGKRNTPYSTWSDTTLFLSLAARNYELDGGRYSYLDCPERWEGWGWEGVCVWEGGWDLRKHSCYSPVVEFSESPSWDDERVRHWKEGVAVRVLGDQWIYLPYMQTTT